MITEEQRQAILELKELAIKIGKATHRLRLDHDIDVRMSINKNAVIIHQIFMLMPVTDEMLGLESAPEPESKREKARADGVKRVADSAEDDEIPAISTRRPNKGMAQAINTEIANSKPIDPKKTAEDVARAQGYAAANEDQNPYSSFRNPELHGKWTEGFIAART